MRCMRFGITQESRDVHEKVGREDERHHADLVDLAAEVFAGESVAEFVDRLDDDRRHPHQRRDFPMKRDSPSACADVIVVAQENDDGGERSARTEIQSAGCVQIHQSGRAIRAKTRSGSKSEKRKKKTWFARL